jgi:hypothetical protein
MTAQEHSKDSIREHSTVSKSLARVGVSARKQLVWLVRFSALSLDALDHHKQLHLCEDLHALAFLSGTNAPPEVVARLTMPSKEGPDWERGTYVHAGFPTWFKLVRECHTIARDALTSFVNHGLATLPTVEIQRTVVRGAAQSLATALDTTDYLADVKAIARGELIPRDPLKPIRSLFVHRLDALLCEDEKTRRSRGEAWLSRCESAACRAIYVKAKKGQRFCSDACRAREAMKGYRIREAEKERARKDREQRKGKVRKPTKGGKHGTKG